MTIGSFLVYKEKLTVVRAVSVAIALFGMVLASGVLEGGAEGVTIFGIALGAIAAVIYAAIVLMNKGMKDIDSLDKTVCQFAVASLLLLPYTLIIEKPSLAAVDIKCIGMLLVIGIIHTGAAYALYFGSIGKLSAVSVGMLGYIDPVVSILVSVMLFSEPLSVGALIGALLIIGASAASELIRASSPKKEKELSDEN